MQGAEGLSGGDGGVGGGGATIMICIVEDVECEAIFQSKYHEWNYQALCI